MRERESNLINPADETVLRTVELLDVAAVDDAVARAQVAPSGSGPRWRPPSGPRPCGRSPQWWTRTSTSSPRSRWPTPGIVIGNAEWEAGHVRDVLQFYSASPERMSGKQIPVAGGLDVTFNEPLGVVARHRAVELPDDDRVVGIRARAGRGQRGAGQAGRDDAADHDAAGRARASTPGCPTACSRCCPARARWSGSASSPTPTSARSSSPGRPRSASR